MVDPNIRQIGAAHDHRHLLADAAKIGRVEGDAERVGNRDTADAQKPGHLFGGDQGRNHAGRVAGLMHDVGYGPEDCDRVARIIRKEGIKRDPEVQALEDVACLVFLRWYSAGFAEGRDMEQVYRIVAKTARKMSAEGRAAAARLDLPAELVPALDI